MTDVCNYADDTGLHACDKELPCLSTTLEHDTALAIEWFEINYMKLNKDKCMRTFGLTLVALKCGRKTLNYAWNSN